MREKYELFPVMIWYSADIIQNIEPYIVPV